MKTYSFLLNNSPKDSDKDTIITSVNRILYNLKQIRQMIFSLRYKDINKSNNIEQYKLPNRFEQVENRLKDNVNSNILCPKKLSLDRLINSWNEFNENFDGSVTKNNKEALGILIKNTIRFLDFLRITPIEKQNDDAVITNKSSSNVSEQKKMQDINNRRIKLRDAISKAKSKDPVNQEEVERLEKQYEQLNQEFVTTRDKLEDAKIDTQARNTMKMDVNDAFDNLRRYTRSIDNEVRRLKYEYYISLMLLSFLIFSLPVCYVAFISKLINKQIIFTQPMDFIPYTTGLVVFIGLIIVCIYLKGRANKISIELNTRLFNIHYLEGLMQMTNTLSIDYGESSKRINDIIGSLSRSYIHKVDENVVSEKQISRWEKKIIKDTPYLKLLNEIKDILIKVVEKK